MMHRAMVILLVICALAGGCDWYRSRERSQAFAEAREKVERWRDRLEMPHADGTAAFEDPPPVELLVGQKMLTVHNLGAVKQLLQADPDALDAVSRTELERQFLYVNRVIDLGQSDDIESATSSLQAALRKANTINRKIGELTGEPLPTTLSIRADERVNYPDVFRVLFAAGESGFDKMRFRIAPGTDGGPNYLASPNLDICPGTNCTPADKQELCASLDIVQTPRGIFVVAWSLLRRADRSRPVSCISQATFGAELLEDEVLESLDVATLTPDTSTEPPNTVLEAHDRRVLSSTDDTCPPVPPGQRPVDAISALIERLDKRIPVCASIQLSASGAIRWGQVAPLFSGLQQRTDVPFKVLGHFDGIPNCSNAVPVSEIEPSRRYRSDGNDEP